MKVRREHRARSTAGDMRPYAAWTHQRVDTVRNTVSGHFSHAGEAIEENMRHPYLNMSVRGEIVRSTGQALLANTAGKSKGKTRKTTQGTPLENTSVSAKAEKVGRRPLQCFRCGLSHLGRDRKARVTKAPEQEKRADSKTEIGELSSLKALAASVFRLFCEERYGDTGAPYHLTDSLRCMRDLTP